MMWAAKISKKEIKRLYPQGVAVKAVGGGVNIYEDRVEYYQSMEKRA